MQQLMANNLTNKRVREMMSHLSFVAKSKRYLRGVIGGPEHESEATPIFGPPNPGAPEIIGALTSKWATRTIDKAALPGFLKDARDAEAELRKLIPVVDERISQEKHAENAERIQQQNTRERERAARAAELKRLIPTDARPIVANLEQDESDGMTDYYGSKTVRSVLLGYARTRRDDFRFLHAAAAALEEIEPTARGPWEEHREKYSMGHGYYITAAGAGRYHGWKVEWGYIGGTEETPAGGVRDFSAVPSSTTTTEPTTRAQVEQPTVRENAEKGGVEVLFPSKPDQATIDSLKGMGFRWSRFQGLWWRRAEPGIVEKARELVEQA